MSQAILAVIIAMLGGFFGAFLNSHTDKEGRLIDRRSVVFGDFMMKFNDATDSLSKFAMEKARFAMDTNEEYTFRPNEWSFKVWEYFQPVYSQERIVRLFLLEKDRKAVTKAFNQAFQQIGDANPVDEITELYPHEYIDQIEKIFLRNLEPELFYVPIFRKLKLDALINKCKTKFK